jgi:hypothetical protein
MSLWSTGTIRPLTAFDSNVSHPAYIAGGHYVIWWKRHQIIVHCNGPREGLVEVLFMCGSVKARMMCDEVEALLIREAVQDGERTPDYWAGRINELVKLMQEARIAEAPGRRRGCISGRISA